MRSLWWSRRAVGLHVGLVVSVPGFFVLGWWQLHRALGGNELSWVYTFEWPFFSAYAVWMWWKLVHEEPAAQPRDGGARLLERSSGDGGTTPVDAGLCDALAPAVPKTLEPAVTAGAALHFDPYDDADPELAAYNRYLARLHSEERGKSS